MRNILILLGTTTLAACSGGGPQTAGGSAVGSGSGTVGGGSSPTNPHSFVNPTETKTYQSQGASHFYNYDYTEFVSYDRKFTLDSSGNRVYGVADETTRTMDAYGQTGTLYSGEARSIRNPGISVSYDPQNAKFSISINQNNQKDNVTFQDPAHRTNFSGARAPQEGVPNLETGDPNAWRTKGVQYLEAGTYTADEYDRSTFFYELPGTTTKYVTYAGFVRNHYDVPVETNLKNQLDPAREHRRIDVGTKYERAAFIFGETTLSADVPKSGTATFNGNMIASMVNNPLLDTNRASPTFFQWITGTAKVDVDFGKGTVGTALSGTTLAPLLDKRPIFPVINGPFPTDPVAIPAGAIFAANGTATIDLVKTGGFTGTFSDATFTFGGTVAAVDIVGGTLDGAFYGPKGTEIGASFRIIGGIPDQRVDIIGSFTGK
jgi:hypothetical protein